MRTIIIMLISGLFWLSSWLITPDALALTQIRLFDLSYHECIGDVAQGNVTSDGSGNAANCFMVTGKAENKSGKTLVDADVFGRIYDANNEPVMQNRGRLGTIMEVPPGISDFEIRISVAANQPTPLQLKQFKAAGFTSQVRPFYYQEDEEE